MRKYLSIFFVVLLCLFSILPTRIKADEVEDEVVETEEVVEEVPNDEVLPDEVLTDEVLPEVSEEEEFETFKEEVQEYLGEYLEQSMVAKIISWAVDAGVLAALFFVYRKYSKYKHTTIEDLMKMFETKMEKWLKEKTDELSKEQIAKITNAVNELEKSNETIMKVLVLMQDNTAKGKAALIEYLGSKTESEEVKQAVEVVNEKLIEKERKDEEVKDAVKNDYVKLY